MASISIRKTIPILIVAPLLISIGCVSGLSAYFGKKSVSQLSESLMARTADHIQTQTLKLLHEAILINSINANAISTGQLNLETPAGWWQHFGSQVEASTAIIDIYFGSEQGDFIDSQKRDSTLKVLLSDPTKAGFVNEYIVSEAGELPETPVEQYEFDHRGRDWYVSAQAKQQPTWSNVYVDAFSKQLLITAAHPIYDSRNQLVGVLGADMLIQDIDRFLKAINISKTGEVFIIEQDGSLVASSDDETTLLQSQGSSESGDLQRIPAMESHVPFVKEAVSHLLETYTDLSLIENNVHLSSNIDGENTLISAHPLKTELGLDWFIIVAIPTSDFTGHLRIQAIITVLMTAAVVLIAVGLGWLVALWIVNPIIDLHEAAVNVKSQTFAPDEIENLMKRDDEIGQFAGVFSKMAEIITQREDSMEEQLQHLRLQIPMDGLSQSVDLSDLKVLQQKAKLIRNMYEEN